jgi:signal transduction histidine kinase
MRDWRVAVKLAAVLTVPLLAFLILAGILVGFSVGSASALQDFSQQVSFGGKVTSAIHDLQRERDRAAGLLASLTVGGQARDISGLAPDTTAVDRSVSELRESASALLADEVFARAYRQAQSHLDRLPYLRQGAAEGWLRTQAAFDSYTEMISSLQGLLPALTQDAGDEGPAQAVRSFVYLSRAKELMAQVRGHLFIVCSKGRFDTGEFERIADVRARAEAAVDQFRASAAPAELARFDDTVTGQAVSNANRLLQTIVGNARAAELGVEAQQWWQASTTQLELIRTVENGFGELASVAANEASTAEWRLTALGSLATVALLLIAVVTSWLIGRTMALALRSLRQQAMLVAQERLPGVIAQLRDSPTSSPSLQVDAIVVATKDEVGEVAQAFTAVHRSAVRLASEQAQMRRNVNEILIKLARRSQALVERQLKLLDTMESSETNPDQLANLFQIDHLATRLRRNDENLLILAESETTRRLNQPVDLHTVAMAASAEIERYTRVQSDVTNDTYVVGYIVTDLVHLLAELLDNATFFSPPESIVVIAEREGPDGSVEITVTDHGIGIPPVALSLANQQLSAPISIDVSAAERMGLVVVSHLARRHGIGVWLSSPGDGVVVCVRIPSKLRTEPGPAQPVPATAKPARYLAEPASSMARVRASDVLRPHGSTVDSVWWSRDMAAASPAQPAHHPVEQRVGGVTQAGLPKRVRPNNMPAVWESKPDPGLPDSSPDETGALLSQLYSGLRRAEQETSA